MGLWGKIFAAGYDRFMQPTERAGLSDTRRTLLAGAAGRVLEIGAGTGANLPHYGSGVAELVLTEPEEPMARQLERRANTARVSARIVRAPAESLPFEDEAFDYVVSTLVLCTVTHPSQALAEIRRVLHRRGRLLFIEHVRADEPKLAWWQDRLRRPWSWFGNGCQCNRQTLDMMIGAGFQLDVLVRDHLKRAPPLVRPLVIGTAVASRQSSGATDDAQGAS